MDHLLCILKSYQVLVAAFLGFTGVVLTMIANAYMQRSQHRRAVEHEKKALRSALKTELKNNKEAYEFRIQQFDDTTDGKHALFPSKIQNHVYNTLLSKIGILDIEEIEKIISAYQLLHEIPYRIRILVGTDSVGGIDNEYIRIRTEHIETVKRMHEIILPKIVEAITSISKQK